MSGPRLYWDINPINRVYAPLNMIIVLLGLDAFVGQERFFNFLNRWAFGQLQRGSLLANSVEFSEQFCFVSYFLQPTQSNSVEQAQTGAHNDFMEFKCM